MRIQETPKLDFSDVLIVPQRSDLESRSQVNLKRKFTFRHSPLVWEGVPVIAANMAAVGTLDMAKELAKHGALTALHKYYSVDELRDFFSDELMEQHTFYTVGMDVDQEISKIDLVWNSSWYPKFINVDVPNGYTSKFAGVVERYRERFPNAVIMAGNVVTANMTEELILRGADIVKVGIGSGSVCTTRIKTGCGFPQLSAIDECSFAAHGKPGGHVCGDGGCTTPGDVAKAFAAGADFVMLGGMLAGTDECEGNWTYNADSSRKALQFFGMSSLDAQEQFNGGMKQYRAAEGKTVEVAHKGSAREVMQDILGGIRSCCTYVGAEHLKNLPKCAEFIKVQRTHNTIFGA